VNRYLEEDDVKTVNDLTIKIIVCVRDYFSDNHSEKTEDYNAILSLPAISQAVLCISEKLKEHGHERAVDAFMKDLTTNLKKVMDD